MTDQEYFYDLYKKAAMRFQNDLRGMMDNALDTFPQEDLMRLETIRFVREGGKRLRTVLAKLVTEFYGVDDGGATATLDTFHKFLLCHDDIIDRDRMRWGAPTVHAALEGLVNDKAKRDHFGNSLAIVSGDLISTTAYRFTLEADLDPVLKVELMKLVCRCMEEVAWGWYDQFLMDYEPLDSEKLSFERIRKSIIWVTGKYTLSFPLRFGYTIVGRPMPSQMEEIADDLGVLFQTGDDLIGLFGDSETSGKSNYGDIVQGKKTIPMWFGYELSGGEQKARLIELVGKEGIASHEVDEVRRIIVESGALAKSKKYMRDTAVAVQQKLLLVEIPDEMRRFLNGFTEYLVDREA